MLQGLFADSHPLSFDELSNALLEQGCTVSPSSLHGCLAGLLGGGMVPRQSEVLAGVETALAMEVHGEVAQSVERLLEETWSQLQDESLSFHPVLPDDSFALDERVVALADWARGFLAGYAQARIDAGQTAEAVRTDSAEALRDFAAIAQAGDDDEGSTEEEERDFLEVVEYMRIAALNVLLDTQAQQAQRAEAEEQ